MSLPIKQVVRDALRAVHTMTVPVDVEVTRKALQDAVARGRKRSPTLVRQAEHLGQGPEVQDLADLSTRTSGFASTSSSGLVTEDLEFQADEGPQGWVPLRIVRPAAAQSALPAVVFLHATGSSKQEMLPRMVEYAQRGYLTAAIDCRYHGDRSTVSGPWQSARDSYQEALVRAWRLGPERPFLLDNVWDLQHLLDYLEQRPEVDGLRIGMTGVSFGGMHAWLCAVADTRIAAAAPMIGVQGFKWAVENDGFHARVASIPLVFAAAAADLGRRRVDAAVVRAVWDKLLPGLLQHYDAPLSLPCLAPRPLLVANGELDPRCPIEGLQGAFEATRHAYAAAGKPANFQTYIQRGLGHSESIEMDDAIRDFFDAHLLYR